MWPIKAFGFKIPTLRLVTFAIPKKKLGTVGDLRIEPYVKLPLNGLGLGSLPLRSTGIYLGITRPIR